MSDRMGVITTRDLIRSVAQRWRRQYDESSLYATDQKKQAIQRRLDALDPETATAAEVEAIIGNKSWTIQACDVCEDTVDALVQLGDSPDWESRTLNVCQPCLEAALELLRPMGQV